MFSVLKKVRIPHLSLLTLWLPGGRCLCHERTARGGRGSREQSGGGRERRDQSEREKRGRKKREEINERKGEEKEKGIGVCRCMRVKDPLETVTNTEEEKGWEKENRRKKKKEIKK